MLTFSLLFWLWLRTRQAIDALGSTAVAAPRREQAVQSPRTEQAAQGPSSGLIAFAKFAVLLVGMQIALGGWTSTNYAALACPDFPTCQEQWLPTLNVADAFHVVRELGKTAEGDMIDLPALTAIHLSHRIGAVMVLLGLSALAFACFRSRVAGVEAGGLLVMLAMQWALGISNVIFDLPLWVAVAHTGGAVVLLALTLLLNFRLQALSREHQGG
ncbi:MAG: hypothetical protein EBX02_11340 [Betaproteobacteria bacterium]|nr:hypothetical protein [Betaproteobacteria bacterium]